MASSRGGRIKFYIEGESADLVRETRTAENALKRLGTQQTRTSTTMRAASTHTADLSKKTHSLAGSLVNAAKYAAGAAAAYLSISQAKAAVTTTQDLAKATMGLHGNLGLSNRAAGEWAAAARARGVDTTKLGMAFKTLSTQVEAARNGSSTAKAMFDSLGISMSDLDQGSRNIPGLMSQIADGMDHAGAGTERLSNVSKLFGRSYAGIAPMIRDGSAALQENLQTTEKYGSALHGKTLKDQAKLRSSLIQSKDAWQGIQVQFTSAITPALTTVNDKFQHLAAVMGNDKLSNAEKFHKIGDTISGWADDALHAFEGVLPQVAEKAGEEAPKIAGALVHGFIDAPILGKLAIGAWLFKAFGGGSAIKAIGGRLGGLVLGGMLGSSATGGVISRTLGSAKPIPVYVVNSLPGVGGEPVPTGGKLGTLGRYLPYLAMAGRAATVAGGTLLLQQEVMRLLPHGSPEDLQRQRDQTSRRQPDTAHDTFRGLSGEKIRADLDKTLAKVKQLADTIQNPKITGAGFAKAIEQDGILARDKLGDILNSLEALPPAARKQAASTMVGMAAEFEDKGKLPKGTAGKLRDSVVTTFHGMNISSVAELEKLARGGDGQFKKLVTSSKHLSQGVSSNVDSLTTNVGAGMTTLGTETNSVLQSFGVKQLTFDLAASIGTGVNHKARGGMLPGYSTVDNVPAMLRSGEAILTPEVHQPIVNNALQATYGMGLGDLFRQTGAAYANGGMVQRLAKGGKAGGMSAMIAEANRFESAHFPYVLGGGHGGFGVQPVDCSGFVSDVLHTGGLLQGAPMVSGALMNWGSPAKGNEPLVVYASPAHTVMRLNGRYAGTSGSNPGGGAGWIEGGSPGLVPGGVARTMDVGAGLSAQIRRVVLNGPDGPLKSMGQAALDKVRGAASRYVQSKMPAGTLGGGDAEFTGGTFDRSRLISLWNAKNPGEGDPSLMATLALRESRGDPNAQNLNTNGTIDRGLWQINSIWLKQLGLTGNSLFNPGINADAAGDVLRIQGPTAWSTYAKGGVVGRLRGFGKGGVAGGQEHYTPPYGGATPTKPPGGATTILGGGLAALTPDEQIALLQIQLTGAAATPGTEDDAAILGQIETLQLGLLTGYQTDYDNLSLTGSEKKGLRRQARAKTAHEEAKLRKLSPAERKKLNAQAAGIQKRLGGDLTDQERAKLEKQLHGNLSPAKRAALEKQLKDKHTTAAQKKAIQKQLDGDLTDKERKAVEKQLSGDLSPDERKKLRDRLQHVEKIQRKGILTADERKELRQDRGDVFDQLKGKALEDKRAELIGKIGTATDDAASTRDQLKALQDNTDAQQAQTDAIKAQAEAEKALADEIAKQNALIQGATNSDYAQALAFIGDLLSGAVGGLVAPRLQTAGAGGVVRS